jgi:ABC transporter, permease protein
MKNKRISFLVKRLLRMIVLLVLISILSFGIVVNSPVDALQAHLGSQVSVLSEEQRAAILEQLDLDKPPAERYLKWAGNILHGDFGHSTVYNQPVGKMIVERFKETFFLMIIAWVLSGILGFLLGVVAAIKEGSWIDKIIKLYCMALASSPNFWLGLLFLMFFAGYLRLFPIGLTGPLGGLAADVTLWERIHHMMLPAITLSLVSLADITLHTRAKLVEVMQSDFILFARANGKSLKEIIRQHALRNILLPAITLQFLSFSELFGGAVFIEQIFSYPGLAGLVQEAAMKGDVALLLGIVLVSAVWIFVGNMIADILYVVIDPRIKES